MSLLNRAADTAPRGAFQIGLALGLVLGAVLVGLAVSIGATLLVRRLLPSGDLAMIAVAAKIFGDLATLALFFWSIRWLAGRDVLVWLMGPGPALAWHTWGVVIAFLYAVKTAGVLAGSLIDGAPGAAIEALKPVAATMATSGWPLLLAAGVVAAIVEEVLFRGYLSRLLEATRLGFWGGATLAAFVWALLHPYYPLGMQAGLVVLGVALSLVRARTGSMYPGMAWHVLNNAVALIAMRVLSV